MCLRVRCRSSPRAREHKPVQRGRADSIPKSSPPRGGEMSAERTERGERVCAVVTARRRVLGSPSRFNRPQSASPTAPPEGERGERSERVCAVVAARRRALGSTSRFNPLSRLRRQLPPRGSGSVRSGRVCAFVRAGSTWKSRLDTQVFSPPRGGDVRGADRGGRACLCVRGRSSPRAREHRPVQPPQSASPTAPPEGERGERVCAFVTARRRVLGGPSRFNRPQSASPTAPPEGERIRAGRACLCGRCRSSPRAREHKPVQPPHRPPAGAPPEGERVSAEPRQP